MNSESEALSRIAADGTIQSPTARIEIHYGNVIYATDIHINHLQLTTDDTLAIIRSNRDLYLDPTDNGTADGKIVMATTMIFPESLGDKIHFWSHSYSIGISPFDLDITSDRNIKFHSDTSPDLMVIWGDVGDVQTKRDFLAGRNIYSSGVYKFVTDSTGDKYLLYGTLYRLAISPDTFDSYSDRYFKWHSDSNASAMTLNADSGDLSIEGAFTAAGTIRSNSGFNINGTNGVSGTISPASTIIVTNGIITGFY